MKTHFYVTYGLKYFKDIPIHEIIVHIMLHNAHDCASIMCYHLELSHITLFSFQKILRVSQSFLVLM